MDMGNSINRKDARLGKAMRRDYGLGDVRHTGGRYSEEDIGTRQDEGRD